MLLNDALSYLGTKRIIWIDDLFNQNPTEVANLLLNSWETAIQCDFQDLDAILKKAEFAIDVARVELTEKLAELDSNRIREIKDAFFAREMLSEEGFVSKELPIKAADRICELLGVRNEDRWTFDKAAADLPALCTGDDADISYVVDLNESGFAPRRGLEILQLLWDQKSKGTAFILTHEARAINEASKEAELRDEIASERSDALGIPICVIAKERLFGAEHEDDATEALKVSIKRAGLRRSLSEVISRSEDVVEAAFNSAAAGLLHVPPEQLEAHVFERGYKEGVSELHVVERILTSQIAEQIRKFFGTDANVLSSIKRLRMLRAIELKSSETEPDPNLAAFRLAEVWESDELINNAFAPLACGDVFETDPHELSVRSFVRKFILLAQPCDIALRPSGKERAQKTAFLVPLKKVPGDNPVEKSVYLPLLPCKLGDEHWACDFRNATTAKLAILDLSSFRSDGRVRVDEGHGEPTDLLDAQSRIYQDRTAAPTKVFATKQPTEPTTAIDTSLQLSFSAEDKFKYFHSAVWAPASAEDPSKQIPALPNRVTWRLRRCGRIRMPYSVALLDQYLSIVSRRAFDLDYMAPGFRDVTPQSKDGTA